MYVCIYIYIYIMRVMGRVLFDAMYRVKHQI